MVMKTRNHSNLPKTVKYLLETIFAITGGEFLPEGVGQISGFYLVAYMTGLILSQHDFTMTGMSYLLKLCLHDSFCRVLRITEFSSSVLLRFFVGCINRIRKTPGWVCIDDTTIAKRFSKCISYASYAFSGNYGKVIMGVHIFVFIWTDGRRRLPLGFKIWKSKKFYQDAEDYKTKSDLALELLSECLDFVRTCDYMFMAEWDEISVYAVKQNPKQRQPVFYDTSCLRLLKVLRRCSTLPQGCPCSTIDAGGLNCRVRNGYGWCPSAIATGNLNS
jgi:hypothetical protein